MLPIPQMVGNYRVVSQLGQGGMARVLLAIRQGPGGFRKLFVVKQLRLDFCDDPNFVAMFLDEAKLAALLNHPNVVQTHETGEDLHSRFISMEYLEGQSFGRLWGRAHRTKSMSLELSIRVIAEVLSGLHYAHQITDLNGEPLWVVHRDISPGNIFVTYDGQVKLLDFGIAKASGSFSQTDNGSLKGKLSYMAPEQAMTKELDCRADIFAVGVILWEAIAGRPMVSRKQEDSVTINNRIRGHEPSIDQVCPSAPEGIRAICRKAMALDPNDRYASAKEMRTALLQYISSVPNPPSADDLATLVCDLFSKERVAIAESISKTIAVDEPISIDSEVLNAWNTYTGDNPLNTPPPLDDLEIEILSDEKTTVLDTDEGQLVRANSAKTNPAKTNPKNLGPAPRDYKRGLILATAGTAIATAIGTLVIVLGGSESTESTESTGKLAIVQETQGTGQASGQNVPLHDVSTDTEPKVQIAVSALPLSARIEIDGELADNPFVGKKLMDSGEHTIRVSARGYESQTRKVTFAENGEWKFRLLESVDSTLTLVGTSDIDDSSSGRRRSKDGQRRRTSRKGDQPTRTVVTEKPVSEKTVPEKSVARDPEKRKNDSNSSNKQPKGRAKMGDDLGEGSSMKSTKVKIDRNNPYQ